MRSAAIPAPTTMLQANLLKPVIKTFTVEVARKRLEDIESECPCSAMDAYTSPELYRKRARWVERRDMARIDLELAQACAKAKSPAWNAVSAESFATPTLDKEPHRDEARRINSRMETPEYYVNRVAEIVELMKAETPGGMEWNRLRNLAVTCRKKAKQNAVAMSLPIPHIVIPCLCDFPRPGKPAKPRDPNVHLGRPCTRGNDQKTIRRRERDRLRKARWRQQKQEAADGQ